MDSDQFVYRTALNRDYIMHIVEADLGKCEELSLLFRMEGFMTTFSTSSEQALAGMSRRRPHAVIVNLVVGEESGLSLLQQIKQLHRGIPIFMTAAASPHVDAVVMAMKLGAVDVFADPLDKEGLVEAVRESFRSNIHVSAMNNGRRGVEVRGFSQLTPREREVLELIVQGFSNEEVGRDCNISPRTVEVHRARVMDKLGARDTADLMRIVLTS